MIPTVTIERVKSEDIRHVADALGLTHRKGFLLCPSHAEKTPSCHLSANGFFKCFGCGIGGDSIGLVMLIRKCSFREAVEWIASRFGIPLENVCQSSDDAERRQRAEAAGWTLYDRIVIAKQQAMDRLHRVDRLCWRIGQDLKNERDPQAQERLWDNLARLAPAQSFFLAAVQFLFDATPHDLARFALASPVDRRKFILEGTPDGLAAAA